MCICCMYIGTLSFLAPEVFRGTSNAGPPLDVCTHIILYLYTVYIVVRTYVIHIMYVCMCVGRYGRLVWYYLQSPVGACHLKEQI